MPDSTAVLTALRDELVSRGLVRKPNVAGALPPCHVEPAAGAPAPGERPGDEDDDALVVTIRLSTTLGSTPFPYSRKVVVDVIYRSKGTDGLKAGRELDAAIEAAIVGRPDYGLAWVMGTSAPVDVLQAAVWGGLGPVSRDVGQGATEQSKLLFEVKREG